MITEFIFFTPVIVLLERLLHFDFATQTAPLAQFEIVLESTFCTFLTDNKEMPNCEQLLIVFPEMVLMNADAPVTVTPLIIFLFARPVVNVLFVKEFALAVPVTLIPYLGISVRWFNVMLLPLVFLERIIAEDCNVLIVLLRIVLLES